MKHGRTPTAWLHNNMKTRISSNRLTYHLLRSIPRCLDYHPRFKVPESLFDDRGQALPDIGSYIVAWYDNGKKGR